MRFSVQGDYVFDRVLVSKEKALSQEHNQKSHGLPRQPVGCVFFLFSFLLFLLFESIHCIRNLHSTVK